MKFIIKTFKNYLPPIFLLILHRIKNNKILFKGKFLTWAEAQKKCSGYDSKNILKKVLNATIKVKNGEAAFERDSIIFNEIEYVWPVLAGLMFVAAKNRGILNVLDFGGALGSSYFQNHSFFKKLPEVKWNVVEQLHYVDAGKEYIQDNRLQFYKSIKDCLKENQPNVVLLSSVLPYLPDIDKLINEIKKIGSDLIIIDRTIVNDSDTDEIYIQHVPSSIYDASYPCRSLSEKLLINKFSDRYKLTSSFPSLLFPGLDSIHSHFKGFIFTKN